MKFNFSGVCVCSISWSQISYYQFDNNFYFNLSYGKCFKTNKTAFINSEVIKN